MLYTFRGGNQLVRFKVIDKAMFIASSKTNNQLVPLKMLFKKEKIDELNLKVNDMNKEDFDKYIVSEFTSLGYYLVNKDASQ